MSAHYVVYAKCPECKSDIPVTISLEMTTLSGTDTWDVIVISDKMDVDLHSFYCKPEQV